MKTNINWNNIRVINGSQNEGFEELVCQLATREPIKDKIKFTRIGKPDGGKEGFWELKNGEIYAWQAKYFTNTFSSSQWSQIDDSVKNTIDYHPRLSRYYICVPIDRPDGKVKGKKSLLEKWREKVQEWQNYATLKGVNLEFEYWGHHELISRLSLRKNEGLTYFWFNQEEFQDSWLEYKNRESIMALGGRYSAELNFELPISKIFAGLSRDKLFAAELNNTFKKLLEKHRYIKILNYEVFKRPLEALKNSITNLTSVYRDMQLEGTGYLDFSSMKAILQNSLELAQQIEEEFYKLRSEKNNKLKASYNSNLYGMELNGLRDFIEVVEDLSYFLSGPMCKLANSPYLILNGDAGSGKSHLLADVVNRRAEKGLQSLFILGENFTTKEMPWTQILQNIVRKPGID